MRKYENVQDDWLLQYVFWSEKELKILDGIDLTLYRGSVADGIKAKIERIKETREVFEQELSYRGFFWDSNEEKWRREVGNTGE